ncbi:MAG TPA: N-acetylmuramoyl-L-alanine amidase [Acidimicrobiales bacterium]|nr:N-acetylmuramoyl-L-alanine amidase [Acidimicrobiales bacterium]
MRRGPVARAVILTLLAAVAACSAPTPTTPRVTEAALPPQVLPAPAVPETEETAAATFPSPREKPEAAAVLSSGGVVVPVLGREGDAWRVSTPCGREAVLSGGTPLPTGPVVIDPGHGGYDPGAVGPNGLPESALNLAVSRHTAAYLEHAGFPTVLTRNGDHGMNLTNRARLAVGLQARAFVSVHHNAAAWAPSAIPGSEMYHQVSSPESKRLAGLIYEEIVAALSAYSVPWVTSGVGVTWRTRSNGDDWYAMVRQPKGVAAALAELAFISNPAEAELLADPEVQRVEGEAVARGIIRFLTTSDAGSGYVEGGQMPPRPRNGPRGGGGGWDECDDPAL